MPGGIRLGAERWETGVRVGMPRLAWSWEEKGKASLIRTRQDPDDGPTPFAEGHAEI